MAYMSFVSTSVSLSQFQFGYIIFPLVGRIDRVSAIVVFLNFLCPTGKTQWENAVSNNLHVSSTNAWHENNRTLYLHVFEVGVSQILSMIDNLKNDGKEIHKTANTQKLLELPNTL